MKKEKANEERRGQAKANSPNTQQELFVFVAAQSTGNVWTQCRRRCKSVSECSPEIVFFCVVISIRLEQWRMCNYTVYVHIWTDVGMCKFGCVSGSESRTNMSLLSGKLLTQQKICDILENTAFLPRVR